MTIEFCQKTKLYLVKRGDTVIGSTPTKEVADVIVRFLTK